MLSERLGRLLRNVRDNTRLFFVALLVPVVLMGALSVVRARRDLTEAAVAHRGAVFYFTLGLKGVLGGKK